MAADALASNSGGAWGSGKPARGKDQIPWSDDVWQLIDEAVVDEIARSRMGAKFLPQVHVHKKRTTVDSDIVVLPPTPTPGSTSSDPSLSVDETTTTRIQEYSVQFRLSPAQMEAEGHYDVELSNQLASATAAAKSGAAPTEARKIHRASTAVSLALKTANILAQAEDLIILNGQNAIAYSNIFLNANVQPLDAKILINMDLGLANIQPMIVDAPSASPITTLPSTIVASLTSINNVIQLPASQVIPVRPKASVTSGTTPSATTATTALTLPLAYQENSLNAVAEGVAVLQGNGYYDNYALVLHTVPYADLHQALPTTLIEPVEPVSHLVTAGIFGTGALPPFTALSTAGGPQSPATGLPQFIVTTPGSTTVAAVSGSSTPISGVGNGNVLYTGVLVSLSGNSMDVVRGLMDDALDVAVTFNQKDANEQYRFRSVQRFALRLKDPSAVVLLIYMDS
jgi:Encapsulating protein for peroxidase